MGALKRWLRWTGIVAAAFAVVVTLLVAGFVLSFARSVPDYDGIRVVKGITAPVTIVRDRYAIPHISGTTLADAAFGLGYAHAQDRLFQMELSRRYIQGRLAELLGPMAVNADVTMRTLGLYRAAQEAVGHLSSQARSVLRAYANGVNAFLAQHKGPWPIAIALTSGAPEPWTEADSLAVLKGMEFSLSGNAFTEIARIRLLSRLGRHGVEGFFPPFDKGPLPAYLDRRFQTVQFSGGAGVPDITASNDWVVDGAHSETGKPLLANDPHLGFEIPSTWYLAHLAFAGENLVGATLAGLPGIVLGRNRDVAWGMTNTGPDTQDLYLEQLNPDNPNEYRTPKGWAVFDSRVEEIKVRFGRTRHITVRTTRHGPVLPRNSTFRTGELVPKGYVLALAWTALTPDDTTFDSLVGIATARDASAFKAALSGYVSPMQNLVYADDRGNIGLALPGRIPIRAPSNDSLGLVPEPGWDARYDWQGFIPFSAMVSIENPASGYIVTANNKTVPDKYPFTLTREWNPSYRHDRIEMLLKARTKHTVASFEAIQRDPVDLYAREVTPLLLAAGPFSGVAAKAAALLENWNGAMLADEPQPLIFAAWVRALAKRIYGDELGDAFDRFWGYRPEFTLRVLENVDGEGHWCDDRSTSETEDCTTAIRRALTDAVSELTADYGSDPSQWRWGVPHKAVHAHPLFGHVPVVDSFFNREVTMDGGAFTVLRADTRMASRRPYAAVHGAGYRAVYDLAEPDRSQYVISTGESGNVYSTHYDDLLPIWARYGYVRIPTTQAVIAKEAAHRLMLKPPRASDP